MAEAYIFPINDDSYREYEDEKYDEFVKNLGDKNIDIPDWVTKRMLLRVLEGEEF